MGKTHWGLKNPSTVQLSDALVCYTEYIILALRDNGDKGQFSASAKDYKSALLLELLPIVTISESCG